MPDTPAPDAVLLYHFATNGSEDDAGYEVRLFVGPDRPALNSWDEWEGNDVSAQYPIMAVLHDPPVPPGECHALLDLTSGTLASRLAAVLKHAGLPGLHGKTHRECNGEEAFPLFYMLRPQDLTLTIGWYEGVGEGRHLASETLVIDAEARTMTSEEEL